MCAKFGLSATKPPSVKRADKRSQLAEARDQLHGGYVDIFDARVGAADYSFERPMDRDTAWVAFTDRYLELCAASVV